MGAQQKVRYQNKGGQGMRSINEKEKETNVMMAAFGLARAIKRRPPRILSVVSDQADLHNVSHSSRGDR